MHRVESGLAERNTGTAPKIMWVSSPMITAGDRPALSSSLISPALEQLGDLPAGDRALLAAWGRHKSAQPAGYPDGQGQPQGMMIIRVRPPALPHLRPAPAGKAADAPASHPWHRVVKVREVRIRRRPISRQLAAGRDW